MGMKRTTVFADEDDLAVIKAAAERHGIAEAELLREAVHLVAMANRTWDEPFFATSFTPTDPASTNDRPTEDDVWTEKAAAYRRTTDCCP